jgi:hypothetical protein
MYQDNHPQRERLSSTNTSSKSLGLYSPDYEGEEREYMQADILSNCRQNQMLLEEPKDRDEMRSERSRYVPPVQDD